MWVVLRSPCGHEQRTARLSSRSAGLRGIKPCFRFRVPLRVAVWLARRLSSATLRKLAPIFGLSHPPCDFGFSILDCGLKQEPVVIRIRIGIGIKIRIMGGGNRGAEGHPRSGTCETWMAPMSSRIPAKKLLFDSDHRNRHRLRRRHGAMLTHCWMALLEQRQHIGVQQMRVHE